MPLVTKLVDKHGKPVRGFEDVFLTVSSSKYLNTSQAVGFVNEPFFLQRLATAMAVRIHSDGADHANEWQKTSTGVVYTRINNKLVRVFDDILDRAQNLLYVFAKEGYSAHRIMPAGRELQLPVNDPRVRAAIRRACRDGRVLAVPEGNSLELSVRASKSGSQFGKHFKPVVGSIAEYYALWLHERNIQGYDGSLTQNDLSSVDLASYVVLRPAGLVSLDDGIGTVDTAGYFYDIGRARGEKTNLFE
jgi:hypothetical protein